MKLIPTIIILAISISACNQNKPEPASLIPLASVPDTSDATNNF